MTTEIISRWSKIRNLSETDAMLELKFLGDIIARNKERLHGNGASEKLLTR